MLPALKRDRPTLADVLPSCLAALSGQQNRLGLPPVAHSVVLLVDGLGSAALKSRIGHARTLASLLPGSPALESGFPTTTAAALATLATGVEPGQHGMVGYSVLDAAHDRVVNQLSGWDDLIDPLTWQLAPTVYETAVAAGFSATAIGPARYRDSGFTQAVLRGATYEVAASITDRLQRALEVMRAPGPKGIVYVYIPELDKIGHGDGSESAKWTDRLELLDGAIKEFIAGLRPTDGALITADHGVVDVAERSHVLFDQSPALIDGIRHVAGEPRCLQLHFEPDATQVQREKTVDAWRALEGERSWIATRDEAIAAGWFGPVRDEVVPRIGDILVAARKSIAYYDGRGDLRGRSMVGQHGSWSAAEVQVPLLRLGAFARP